MTTKHHILVAEDDNNIVDLLRLLLQDSFEITFASTGTDAIALIEQQQFDFAILDIHLPGVDGLEICRRLKDHSSECCHQTEVIILSGDNSEETVKTAYDLGVGDFISKPFDQVTFRERVANFSRDLEETRRLCAQDEQIRSIADTAMKQAAAYGGGLELIAKLNQYDELSDIARVINQHFAQQGVATVVQFRMNGDIRTYDVDRETANDVEVQVFELLHARGRIYQFGRRCIYNDEHVSLLVKNMPKTGTPSYDAILDLAAKLVPALDARFVALHHQKALEQARDNIETTLDTVSANIMEVAKSSVEFMDNLTLQIRMSFHALDLNEEQEAFLLKLLEKHMQGRNTIEQFSAIQQNLQQCLAALPKPREVAPPPSDEGADDDIELF